MGQTVHLPNLRSRHDRHQRSILARPPTVVARLHRQRMGTGQLTRSLDRATINKPLARLQTAARFIAVQRGRQDR